MSSSKVCHYAINFDETPLYLWLAERWFSFRTKNCEEQFNLVQTI